MVNEEHKYDGWLIVKVPRLHTVLMDICYVNKQTYDQASKHS